MVNNDLNDINKRIEKRLIEKGALLDKYFEIDYLTVEETEEFLKIFSEYIKANKPKKYQKKEK